MTRGWFVGSFIPTAFDTDKCEVAYKEYKAGDEEEAHFHKIATEITVIIEGEVLMNESTYKKGDVIIVEPHEVVKFSAITDAANIVVKVPGAKNDKYTT